jgi:hypothetical protein
MDPHDPNHTEQGYWPNDWPGHDPAYDPDRASIDEECAGIFAERDPRFRSGHHRASDATWARARADYLAGESAAVVCDRYGMRVSTLRNRAASEGWRRQDQPDPEPVDLEAELEAGLPDYADMANHALIRLNRAILKGHATEAGRWMRLHRTLLDMARKPPAKPAPKPAPMPNPLMDALEAQVAEIQAMARALAGGDPDGSDGSDGSDGILAPSPLGEGVGGEGLSGSFGVRRRTGPATAFADGHRRPSSGAHAPPSPTGRRTEVPADRVHHSDHSDHPDGISPPDR